MNTSGLSERRTLWRAALRVGLAIALVSTVDSSARAQIGDVDGDGVTVAGGDCDDGDSLVAPGFPETCDGRDNDCDASTDEGCDRVCDEPPAAPTQSIVPYAAREASLTWAGESFGAAWIDDHTGTPDVYFARLDRLGAARQESVAIGNGALAPRGTVIGARGNRFLVAWEDGRSGNPDVYLRLVDAFGTPGNQVIPATATAAPSIQPAVTWGRERWGLVYTETFNGVNEVFFKRVTPVGAPDPDGARRLVSPIDGTSWEPSIAWSGSGFGVAWREERDGNAEIYFRRLDPIGQLLGGPLRVTTTNAPSVRPVVRWAADRFAIVWEEGADGEREVFFAAIGASGNLLVAPRAASPVDPTESREPSLAWSGEELLLVWHDEVGAPGVQLQRLEPDGNAIGPPLAVSSEAGPGSPAIAWDGGAARVLWSSQVSASLRLRSFGCRDRDGDGMTAPGGDCEEHDASSFTGAPETCDGRDTNCNIDPDDPCPDRLCEAPRPAAPSTRITDVTSVKLDWDTSWSGSEAGLVWIDDRDGAYEVYFTTVDADGVRLVPDRRVTTNPSLKISAQIAWNGQEFGLVWRDTRDDPNSGRVYFTRVDRLGNRLGPDLGVTTRNDFADVSVYELLWTGDEYVLVWADDRDDTGDSKWDVYVRRLNSSGNPMGEEIRLTPSGGLACAAAWTGSFLGLVYHAHNNITYFLALDASVRPLGARRPILTSNIPDYLSMVWNGQNFGLAFNDDGPGAMFSLLGPVGDVLVPPFPLDYPRIAYPPRIVWTGNEFGLAWGGGYDVWRVLLARISPAGEQLGPLTRVDDKPNDSVSVGRLGLVWTGNGYGVPWYDARWSPGIGGDISYTRMKCCPSRDSDGDSAFVCDDCDDLDARRFPSALEICDALDNDCNTLVDDGAGPPAAATALALSPDKVTLAWPVQPGADVYDVTRGEMNRLLSTAGDFTAATTECIANDTPATSAPVPAAPSAGEAFFYLHRSVGCGGQPGSYDDASGGQQGDRDAEIGSSSAACP